MQKPVIGFDYHFEEHIPPKVSIQDFYKCPICRLHHTYNYGNAHVQPSVNF